jgi:very-short-patch-repair endonuclease
MEKCENCGNEYKNIITHKRYCDISQRENVIRMYNNGLSIKKISNELKLSKSRIISFLDGNTRSISESIKIAHKLYPDKFKHTEESKKKMREIRLEWMRNNPEKTAWRLYNFSYPEKIMFDKFLEIGFDKKYLIIREKSFFPYFIDFAFENEKLALEIDGSQHLLKDRKDSDDKKDKLLIENGWKVIRVTEFDVKNNIDNIIEILRVSLDEEFNGEVKRVGFLKEVKKYSKKEKNELGFTEKQIESILRQRRVERPPLDVLIKEINDLGYEGVGRKYGVTGNSIKKWIKTYNKLKL